ncbi:MAG TPA: hypothetical protein ENI33_00605 [Thermoplasmatales archaeon]|nr:hypothetical protein [Thermoplasmatales archaeon]
MYWLRDTALAHGAKLTVSSNGEFMEFVEDFGDQELIKSYLDAGFNWGTHIHPLWRRDRHDWVLETPDVSEEIVRRIWQDNTNAVNSIIGSENNYGVAPYQCAQPLLVKLMNEFGFTIETALTEPAGILAYENFGHYPWNPFHPSPEAGKFLKECLNQTQYILIPHYPQLEPNPGPSGPRSLGTNQKYFIMEYIEWLHWQRNNLPAKVWVFGIATHDCYNNPNRIYIETMLSWLDENFIGKKIPTGEVIAEYATATQIAEEFLQWEAEHPGMSSFSWEEGQPYPYTYSDMPRLLKNAEYDCIIDISETISCYKFKKDNSSSTFVLWSWGEEQIINFSSQISGKVRVYDGKGNESLANSSNLKVGKEPMFVEDGNPPTIFIQRPKGHLYIFGRDIFPTIFGNTIIIGDITVNVNATDNENGIEKIEFYVDDELKEIIREEPYEWLWDEKIAWKHKIKVVAYDKAGNTADDEEEVVIFNIIGKEKSIEV